MFQRSIDKFEIKDILTINFVTKNSSFITDQERAATHAPFCIVKTPRIVLLDWWTKKEPTFFMLLNQKWLPIVLDHWFDFVMMIPFDLGILVEEEFLIGVAVFLKCMQAPVINHNKASVGWYKTLITLLVVFLFQIKIEWLEFIW